MSKLQKSIFLLSFFFLSCINFEITEQPRNSNLHIQPVSTSISTSEQQEKTIFMDIKEKMSQVKDYVSEIRVEMPDIDVKGGVAKIGEYMPDMNFSVEGAKEFFMRVWDQLLKIVICVGLGTIAGALLPLALTLILLLLTLLTRGLTSLLFAICFQSPTSTIGSMLTCIRSLKGNGKLLRWTPYSFRLGGFVGFGVWIFGKFWEGDEIRVVIA